MPGTNSPSSADPPNSEISVRRYPRLRCFVAVVLRAKDPDLFVMGNLSTIGLGGCGIEMENPLEIGLAVEVAPFESERLSVAGKVVNLRLLAGKPGYGIGIEFAEASEQKADFVKFVEGKTQVDNQEYWYPSRIKRGEEENL
jgi:hypothetical protein